MPDIEITGLEDVVRGLSADLTPALQATTFGIATEVQDRISPYPQQPAPSDPNRWYERGYGSKYRRKDGGITGRKTSERLSTRWDVQRAGAGAVLRNSASYSGLVHDSEFQTRQHQATGWKTEQVADTVFDDGTAQRIAEDAVTKTLGFNS